MATTKRGDGTPWVFTASDAGAPVDLTAAESARLVVAHLDVIVIDVAVAGDVNGVVIYQPVEADVAEVRRLLAELEVFWPGWTLPQTFPTKGQAVVDVVDDLG